MTDSINLACGALWEHHFKPIHDAGNSNHNIEGCGSYQSVMNFFLDPKNSKNLDRNHTRMGNHAAEPRTFNGKIPCANGIFGGCP